jgi:hypothetical protein
MVLATTDPAQCADFCVSQGAAYCNILITSAGTFVATGTAYSCSAWPANTYALYPYFASISVSYGGSCE